MESNGPQLASMAAGQGADVLDLPGVGSIVDPLACLAQRLRLGRPYERLRAGQHNVVRTAEAVRITAQVSGG
jgi:hypothetical protein